MTSFVITLYIKKSYW